MKKIGALLVGILVLLAIGLVFLTNNQKNNDGTETSQSSTGFIRNRTFYSSQSEEKEIQSSSETETDGQDTE